MECSDRSRGFWVGDWCWLLVWRVGSEGDDDAPEKVLIGSSITISEREAAGFVLGGSGIAHKDQDGLGNVGGYLAQIQRVLWVFVRVVRVKKSWIEDDCLILRKSMRGRRRRRRRR